MRQIPFSVLDLAPVLAGETPHEALQHSAAFARHAEALGFHRFWLAEHHNMPGLASAATAVVICHIASATRVIRVGAGGIMLSNHPPLVIAEQFGTLESLYPGRIDLGLGRAPGGDAMALRALRRGPEMIDRFPEDLRELRSFFEKATPNQKVCAVPGAGLSVPIWILGSSAVSAKLAAASGLPFAFAAHFSPEEFGPALSVYRSQFRPSAALSKPCVMIALNVVAADTDAEACRLLTSLQQALVYSRRGEPALLRPPLEDVSAIANEQEWASVKHTLRYAIVGTPNKIWAGLRVLIEETQADELIIVSQIYDQIARRRSLEIIAEVRPKKTNSELCRFSRLSFK